MKKMRVKNRGLSLIEMMVVLGIIAIISGFAVVRLSEVFGVKMKRSTNKLASTVRYLYDLSITQGLYIRLVMDLENQSYMMEATRDPYRVEENKSFGEVEEREKEAKEKDEDEPEEKKEVEKDEDGKPKKGVNLPSKLQVAQPTFTPMQSRLLKPTSLPSGIFFKDVYVEHLKTPVDVGKVAIHFFPSGRVERAIINLKDEADEINSSITINPITGTAKVEWEYKVLEKGE